MGVDIKRIRWIIIRDEKEIFCGLARHYEFKPIENIGNTAIKTYLSENKARASFISSWDDAEKEIENGRIRFAEVIENVKEVGEQK